MKEEYRVLVAEHRVQSQKKKKKEKPQPFHLNACRNEDSLFHLPGYYQQELAPKLQSLSRKAFLQHMHLLRGERNHCSLRMYFPEIEGRT